MVQFGFEGNPKYPNHQPKPPINPLADGFCWKNRFWYQFNYFKFEGLRRKPSMILYINQIKGHETVQIHFLRNCHPPPPKTKQNTTYRYRLMVKPYTSNISNFQLATFFPCTKHHLWVSLEVVFRFTVPSTPTWRQAFCSLRASCSNCWSCKRLTILGMPNWLVVESTHLNNMLVKGEIFPNFRGEHSKNIWNHYLLLRIQVCPKKGISLTILCWAMGFKPSIL